MSELNSPPSNEHRFSIRTLLGVVAVIAIGLMPTVYFGWKGILSSVVLVVAGLVLVFGRRGVALGIVILLFLGQGLHPALDGARDAILRSDCERNLRQLTVAIHDFEAKYGHIPPPYSTDDDGKPLHSWRVLLLPFLGHQSLYDQIDKSKPWDDPVNLPFHDMMPDIYCCASVKYHSKWRAKGNTTAYVVVVGKHTPWHSANPPSLAQIAIADGNSSTIAIVESEPHRLPWMSTQDPTLETVNKSFGFSSPHDDSWNCSYCDASTHSIPNETDPEIVSNLILMDNGK